MISPASILTKKDMEKEHLSIPHWLKIEYGHWKDVVSNKGFPCPFGTAAETLGHLRYFYVEKDDFHALPDALMEFLKLSRESKHRHAFVIFIKPEIPKKSFAYYENYFWKMIDYLHEHDSMDWCEDIPIHPEDPSWEFCFGGEPMFISVNMPAYKHRMTRNIGNSLILIFQPRTIFSGISYQRERGKKTIDYIRSKVESIENLPFHPDLGDYHDENYREWKQYIITDGTEPRSGKCPFRPKK